ncbi:universal stress protein [Streptomyces sp. NBC_00708]
MNSAMSTRYELGTVVVGVDGSPSGGEAVFWAAAEADRRGRSLLLVHGADTDTRATYTDAEAVRAVREAGGELLDESVRAVRARFPALDVSGELSRQEPVSALLAAAGERGTVVVGNRGLGGFASLTLGSVGLGVAARADVPVVVVRGAAERPATGSVTAAVRGTEDEPWIAFAAAEAQARGAALELVSVWNVLSQVGSVATMLDDLDGMARERVHEVKNLADRVRALHPGLVVKHHVATGTSVPGTLVDAGADTDLMVTGRSRRRLTTAPAPGRVAHALIHHAHCPVAVVPAAPTAGADTT